MADSATGSITKEVGFIGPIQAARALLQPTMGLARGVPALGTLGTIGAAAGHVALKGAAVFIVLEFGIGVGSALNGIYDGLTDKSPCLEKEEMCGKNSLLAQIFPWLGRTGQLWKMRVTFALLGLTIVGYAKFIWLMNNERLGNEPHFLAWLLFLGIGSVTLLWVAFAFRCPQCRAPVSWLLMRSTDHKAWWPTLMGLQCCPRCRGQL